MPSDRAGGGRGLVREEGRGGDQDQAADPQLAHDEVSIFGRKRANVDGKVDAVGQHVHIAVAAHQFQPDRRMRAQEARQQRREHQKLASGEGALARPDLIRIFQADGLKKTL